MGSDELIYLAKGFAKRWLRGDPGLGAEPLTELFIEAMLEAYQAGKEDARNTKRNDS